MANPQPAPAAQAKEIVLQLGDLLNRIPKEYLQPGPHDPKQPVRFQVDDLADFIGTGKSTISLDRLARACPNVIKQNAAKGIDVPFPFQKVVGQIPPSVIASMGKSRAQQQQMTFPLRSEGTAAGDPANGNLGHDEEKIHLSLHAIVSALPADWRTAAMSMVDVATRVALPLRLVEHQLPTGRVEVPMAQFLAGLPAELRPLFPPDPKRTVMPIPLTEVFPNLPDHPPEKGGTPGLREQVANLESAAVSRDPGKVSDELAKKLVDASARIDSLARERDTALQKHEELVRELEAARRSPAPGDPKLAATTKDILIKEKEDELSRLRASRSRLHRARSTSPLRESATSCSGAARSLRSNCSSSGRNTRRISIQTRR